LPLALRARLRAARGAPALARARGALLEPRRLLPPPRLRRRARRLPRLAALEARALGPRLPEGRRGPTRVVDLPAADRGRPREGAPGADPPPGPRGSPRALGQADLEAGGRRAVAPRGEPRAR